ncbi:MAG TPA: hypothetical protein VFQ68_14515 [Streptosporangiaceae bacterium]|nr:hypothetical protein [Streptosporangiaceae bacterium]
MRLPAERVVRRAAAATWRARLGPARQRAARSRHVLVSAALVVAGLAGLLGFASLVGGWCVGLTGMAESAAALWAGLARDDGTGRGPGAHEPPTLADVLARARHAP